MANVASYDEVLLKKNSGSSTIEDESIQECNEIYHHAYGIYEEMLNGGILEDDCDLVETVIQNLEEKLARLKADFLVHDQSERETMFSNDRLRHYRTHFNNLKKGLEEELAKLQGGEVDDRRNAKQTEAIHAQISALKAMKEQIEEQINALSQAL